MLSDTAPGSVEQPRGQLLLVVVRDINSILVLFHHISKHDVAVCVREQEAILPNPKV
jgi:hypothetical protein